jgi:CRISPR-associated protein Csx10
MEELKIKIELMSDTLIGSGSGCGSTVDTDIIYDELGLPYIPAKRLKGLLKDSAIAVVEMLEKSRIITPVENKDLLKNIFGNPGQNNPSGVYFSNLHIEEYEKNREFLASMQKTITPDLILNSVTRLRQQTAIDPSTGTAEDHSLRTVRVINKGLLFTGSIQSEKLTDAEAELLILAGSNLKRIGTKRNRGFGEIKCTIVPSEFRKLNYDIVKQKFLFQNREVKI